MKVEITNDDLVDLKSLRDQVLRAKAERSKGSAFLSGELARSDQDADRLLALVERILRQAE